MKLAVIGSPIAHSLSPAMHNAALQAMGIEGTYEAIEVLPQNLGAFMAKARTFDGFNVTVPYKELILACLDVVDTAAARARSVNTVCCDKGCLTGLSTDGIGLERALIEAFGFVSMDKLAVAFIGCGGAVQSAAHHFALRGAKKIVILNRTVEKAEKLVAELHRYPNRCQAVAGGLDETVLLADVDVVIQGSSLGLRADDPLPCDPARLPSNVPVYDMIYQPTPFQKACAARGLRVSDGRGMLLYQGVAALAHWTKREPPVEVMRAALEKALKTKAGGEA